MVTIYIQKGGGYNIYSKTSLKKKQIVINVGEKTKMLPLATVIYKVVVYRSFSKNVEKM